MNIYDEKRPDTLKASLADRVGEQVFRNAQTRLERQTMATAAILIRYINAAKDEKVV